MKLVDLTGQKFGRLTVFERGANDKRCAAMWLCKCDCGNKSTVRGAHLRSGRILSCGCYAKDQHTTHGKARSAEYRTYYNMIKRCEYENDNRYKDYGGRGIQVCFEWRQSFEQFLSDMGPRPSDSHSIDRTDVNGNYEPSNCRWADIETQERNKRTRKDSETGVRGVRIDAETGKYIASIYFKGKNKRIGTFPSLEEAAKARKEEEKVIWSE